MLGGLTSAGGQIASAAMQASAIKEATQMQIAALERARQYVYDNLNPSVVNDQALAADTNRAANRLALQGQIDPALLNSRYASEDQIARQSAELGQGNAKKVADQATLEATSGGPQMEAAKQKLIDTAMEELKAGATLPPDVQAEMVKAGLEQSGAVTGHASGQGAGGTILRTVLGTAGLNLKKQRQQQAAGLITSAQNLASSRSAVLQSLFPSLTQTQLANLQGSQGVLAQSNSMIPDAGLSGSDVANIWLARVGATNQLSQQAAQAGANGAMGLGSVYGNLAGGLAGTLGRSGVGQIANGWLNSISAPSGGGGADFGGELSI